MPLSITSTSTAATPIYSLDLMGRAPTPTSTLMVEPLVPSGALEAGGYGRAQLTPAIGAQYSSALQLKFVLALPIAERDNILRDLAIDSPSLRPISH
jgi:hypothetical protein